MTSYIFVLEIVLGSVLELLRSLKIAIKQTGHGTKAVEHEDPSPNG